MFTCFAVTWLFFVVYGISMCRCSPIRDCIVVHSHKPGRLQCELMKIVEDLTLLRHQNYNYYYCVDYCCCEIASIALMLYWIIPDSLFAKLAPCLIDTCYSLFFFSIVSAHSKSLDWISFNSIKFAQNLLSTNYNWFSTSLGKASTLITNHPNGWVCYVFCWTLNFGIPRLILLIEFTEFFHRFTYCWIFAFFFVVCFCCFCFYYNYVYRTRLLLRFQSETHHFRLTKVKYYI